MTCPTEKSSKKLPGFVLAAEVMADIVPQGTSPRTRRPAWDASPVGGEPGHLLERQVDPLAGEEGERATHQIGLPSTSTQLPPRAELASIAASTRWTAKPSSNDGV